MASTIFSIEATLQSLADKGYVILEDTGVGNIASEMEQKGFPFLSMYGLEYLRQHVLENTRVRSVLEGLFDRCSLGHWLRYKELPGHIECFSKAGSEAELHMLAIHQFPKGSAVACWDGSHQVNTPTVTGRRSTFETTQSELLDAHCTASEREFPEGGLMIRDPRLFIEIRRGYTITFLFATEEVLARWPKILLLDLPEIRERVAHMESMRVGMNIVFQGPASAINT
ncbi:uncharacterized protein EKO05_0007468 [Ascochyta rabiei]|uniref:uncharacterized protein n=1 Tax=Didymella rabiei TaxID=5454 RepID=UPI0021FD1AAB|nr:uncharacterized protein EKO05_0007468 [Ascochyta rabiei]UPX17092.1 hypothetical protein EKO05_0007468 [Ascochyta rabiei]